MIDTEYTEPMTTTHIQRLMGWLRNVAEVDACDVTANAASDLAVRLEAAGANLFGMSTNFAEWTPSDQATARYAISKRHTYILDPDARHARDINRI